MKYLIFFILLCAHLQAATYYVTKAGNNTTGTGAIGAPWLTIAKAATVAVAGDTVMIGDGDYDESIEETTSGTAGNFITYRAINSRQASMRAWRLNASYIKLDALKISKYSGVGNTWGAAVRIDPSSDGCVITNCWFADQPMVLANDFRFPSANTIRSDSSNFIAAGFAVGSKIYLGACGYNHPTVGPLWYENHDTTWTVASLTTTTMTLTSGSQAWINDSAIDKWAMIRCGTGNPGFPTIIAPEQGGDSPQGYTISNNLVSNWASHAMNLDGDGYTVEGNELTTLHSFRFLSFTGSNIVIRRNFIRNSPNVLWFTNPEIQDLDHPEGIGWYDNQVGMIAASSNSGNNQNILVEQNVFYDLTNQMGRVDDQSLTTYDIRFSRNLFMGISEHFSGGRDSMKWTNNTFYKCTFETAGHPLSIGGRLADANTGYEVTGNLFVACGRHGETETLTRGYYTDPLPYWLVSPVTDYNFVTSHEVTGYAPKTDFTEVNGVNGGDPLFYDALNPFGVDGVPWTDDDGMKVLAHSPAAAMGGGAFGVRPVTTGQPVAHFKLASPLGWFEPIGDLYDPAWLAKLPTNRGNQMRPWNTVASIGEVPVTASFTPAASLSGVAGATTNTAIGSYIWNWGDGTPNTATHSPATVFHTFTTPGTRTVTLTVTNNLGASHTTTQQYQVTGLAPDDPRLRSVPSEYATIQLAVNAAQPGDTIVVAPGTYNESVTSVRSGASDSRITIDGGAAASVTIRDVTLKHAYITIKRATISGNTTSYASQLYLRKGAHFTRIENCVIDGNYALKLYGINWEGPTTKPFGTDAASDCVITGSTVRRVKAYPCVSMMGDRNIIENCTIGEGIQVDFFRLWGRNNILRGNVFDINILEEGLGNHPDFIQTFGNNGFGSSGHIIERNIVGNALGAQLTQLEGNLLPDIRDWTFRNNIFHNIGLQASCTIPAVKYYNNVFYRCNIVNGGSALNFGSRFYETRSVADVSPSKVLIATPIPSGSLVNGGSYRVYANSSLTGTVTYNGVVYEDGDTFTATSVLTYTQSDPAVTVMRRIANHAHDTDIRGNVFLECGNGSWTKGWYSFGTTTMLTGIIADYNYVALAGYAPMRQGVASYGDPGWDFQKFYEPNGINGGDPGMQDPASLNFVLHDGALLVDRSTTLDGIHNDFNGDARPFGEGFDIGAYENQSGTPPEGPPDPPILLPAVINATTTTAISTTVTPTTLTP